MKFFYDLHIHSALSPCADDDMTPSNIANMSLLKELDMIAVTDHNSCKNARACAEAASRAGLLLLPGVEVETSEEVHCVVLFSDINEAERFGAMLESRLAAVKNREDIFGNQLLLNCDDEITGKYETLLLNAAAISVTELFKIAADYGAAAFPAHVDRDANGVISNLGAMPADLGCEYIEISARTEPEEYLAHNKNSFSKKYGCLRNSDAHRLGDINERAAYLEFEKKPSARDVVDKIRNG